MVRTSIFTKVTDSDASPHITQKDVVMCRSGIQLYHKSELSSFMSEDNKPAVDKEWYKEYRPASVVVKAKELCKALPVTCEHPMEWVTPDNFKELAGGVTDNDVEVVALDGEADGEIGLKSNITFFTRDLHDYYLEHKEVSLGYTVKKHFVANPDEVGYDILLDEITEVNHLAITRSGRGGSSVAVIDSIIGGMKPMRTGIWSWLKSKCQKDSVPSSFGKTVFDALHSCKGSSEDELNSELKGVLDSCTELKDCPQKSTMLDMIRDCYDSRDKAFEHEQELVTAFDSMYVSISGDSLGEIVEAVKNVSGSKAPTVGIVDSDEKKEDKDNKENCLDSGEKKDDEQKDTDKEAEDKKEQKDIANTDSLPLNKDTITQIVKDSLNDSLKDVVTQMVKDTLGIKGESTKKDEGMQMDSASVAERDYSEFLM